MSDLDSRVSELEKRDAVREVKMDAIASDVKELKSSNRWVVISIIGTVIATVLKKVGIAL